MTTLTVDAPTKALSVDAANRMIAITWEDGTTARYPFLWLRHNDPSAFHPETKERMIDVADLDLSVAPTDARIDGDALEIRWPDIEHPSRLGFDFLATYQPGRPTFDPADQPRKVWRADLREEDIPHVDATEILTSDEVLYEWMRETRAFGLSIVTGLKDDREAGQEVARRISFLRQTNFGVFFEVKSKPNPINLAYTALALPMHTDLPNQDLPPGIQFLHCIANEAEGGGSVFCDGYALAEDMRRDDPEAFDRLANWSVPFRFHDDTADLRNYKRTFMLDHRGEVSEICFSSHLADVIDMEPERIEPYYAAFKRFSEMARDPRYVVTLRLNGGEMAVFDNRRVLHGREAFDPNTGYRHLNGCYVDRGEFDSRLRVLHRQLGK